MKKTIFNQKIKDLGGKMIPFAGYEMPVQFSQITQEHLSVRNNAGLFDVSHMGRFNIKGSEAFDFIQLLTTNDISKLTIGKIEYTCMTNQTGGIIDDLLVYKINDNEYMLVVNAANAKKDWNWLHEYNKFDVEIKNLSNEMAQLALQGPNAKKIIQKLTEFKLDLLKYYTFAVGTIANVEQTIISATGYTGAGGFELYIPNSGALKIWEALFEAGKEFNLQPAGLGARDSLRLEMGFRLHGNDINENTTPLEAGLGWVTKLTENNNFIGKEALLIQKQDGLSRKLVAFKLLERGIPRKDYEIQNAENESIGNVTSGIMSPVLQQGIGMGYVKIDDATIGTQIYIAVRNKKLKAEIVKTPFI